ncbi:helix-turn-helix transcriptional regulator [Candidatus Woesearchaeota archaeon]|nr:helix-turn-helix transcriptional regulator [Candidatus Woesearchaeota archaeon]
MVKSFKRLKCLYFPKGGNAKKLGISPEYLELLIDGFVPASRSLLLKISKEYNVPLNEISDYLVDNKGVQPLLFASETLSNNKEFVKRLNLYDSVSFNQLAELVSYSYESIHVKGRLSTILTNVSNYFTVASMNPFLSISSESEFNEFANLKNPFVVLHHENIGPYRFIKNEKINGVMNYFVVDEFLPLTVKSISTDSSSWRKRFVEGRSPRKPNLDFPSYSDDFNKVLVEYKKPIKQDIIEELRRESEDLIRFPEFDLLSKGLGNNLFDEQTSFSKLHSNHDVTFVNRGRPAMSLENDYVVGFYFYPVQVVSHSLSGGGDSYFPGPVTLKLANRFQNHVEGRIRNK